MAKKMDTAALLLAGSLVSGIATADNTKPPVLEGAISNETVTLYTDATSINIAQVVDSGKKSVSYNAWCQENPTACADLKNYQNNRQDDVQVSVTYAAPAKNIDFIAGGNGVGLGLNTQNFYGEVTGNLKDQYGAGLAYKSDIGLVAGASIASKENVGTQPGVGLGYVTNFSKGYAGVMGKTTEFNAKGIYVDAKSKNFQFLGGYEVASGLFVEGSVGQKTSTSDGYDTEKRTVGNLGLAYVKPDYAIRVSSTLGELNNKVNLTLSIPFGGKNNTSPMRVGQDSVARFVANSSFDSSIVKVKKAPVQPETPETPNTAPTATAGSVNGGFAPSKTFSLAGQISDAETPNNLTIVIVQAPTNGTLSISGTNVTYSMNSGYAGDDSFTFKVVDPKGAESNTVKQDLVLFDNV